jgi:hemoglobin
MAIYDDLGGRAVVELVVDLFYRRVLADPRLAPRFADVDLTAQMGRQCLFLAFAMGRLARYDAGAVRDAHADLGLDDAEFDAMAAHLAAALADVGASGNVIAKVMAQVATTRGDVVAFPRGGGGRATE